MNHSKLHSTGTKGIHCMSEQQQTLPKLTEDAVILAFGDSLTYGTGAAAGQSYPEVLEKLIGRTVINAGIPGEITALGLARLPGILDRYRPSFLILCHGANDLVQNFSELEAADNIRGMINFAGERGIKVVLIGMPYPGIFTAQPPLYAKIAGEFSIPFARTVLSEILSDISMKSDSIHPNTRGYRKLAEAVASLLLACGAV